VVATPVSERSPAATRVRPAAGGAQHPVVYLGVALTLVATRELAPAQVTREWLFSGMRSQVRRQVVGAAERPRTHHTLERFLTGVNSDVTRQLIAARKPALTARHGADVRPLGDWATDSRHQQISDAQSCNGRR